MFLPSDSALDRSSIKLYRCWYFNTITMDQEQRRPSVFDRLGSRVVDAGQAVSSEPPSHVSVIVSAPARRQSTSSESGSCTTTDEEEGVISPIRSESLKSGQSRGSVFDRINVNQRRVSSPAIPQSNSLSRLPTHPSASRERGSLTPPHLKDKRGLLYDRHGNLRVPLADKIKTKSESSRPNSSSPSTTSSSGTNRRNVSWKKSLVSSCWFSSQVNSPTDYRQYYLEYQRSKSKEGDSSLKSGAQGSSSSRRRSNRPPFVRQNEREGESPSHSSRPSRGSSLASSSDQRGSVIASSRKSRLERRPSLLTGDVSPISASGSDDFDDTEMMGTRGKRRMGGRLEGLNNPETSSKKKRKNPIESGMGEEGRMKRAIMLSDLSDGEFTGEEGEEGGEEGEVGGREPAATVSDLDSISDNELTEIIGECDHHTGMVGSSTSRREGESNVYRDIEIDWSSLISSSAQPKLDTVISQSARKRYTGANVLNRIGFSPHFAGESLTKKIVDFCHKQTESTSIHKEPNPRKVTRCFHQIIIKKRKDEERILLFPYRKPSFVCLSWIYI